MRKSNLYYALIIKYGTLEQAAKAFGMKPIILEKWVSTNQFPIHFLGKVVKTLGIEDKPEIINFVFGL